MYMYLACCVVGRPVVGHLCRSGSRGGQAARELTWSGVCGNGEDRGVLEVCIWLRVSRLLISLLIREKQKDDSSVKKESHFYRHFVRCNALKLVNKS